MHPALTYGLLALCAGVFGLSWWIDARPEGSRLAAYRRFTLVMQIVAIGGAIAVLRPGRGTHDDPSAFAAVIGNGTPALIDAYSNWCGPCLAAKPAVDAMERDLRGRVNVVRVDVEAPAAALVQRRYGLRGTPTYVLVDGAGNERWRQVGGAPNRAEVDRVLAQLAR
jgi:thiol-disulfide isomerase/thioredoxin